MLRPDPTATSGLTPLLLRPDPTATYDPTAT